MMVNRYKNNWNNLVENLQNVRQQSTFMMNPTLYQYAQKTDCNDCNCCIKTLVVTPKASIATSTAITISSSYATCIHAVSNALHHRSRSKHCFYSSMHHNNLQWKPIWINWFFLFLLNIVLFHRISITIDEKLIFLTKT